MSRNEEPRKAVVNALYSPGSLLWESQKFYYRPTDLGRKNETKGGEKEARRKFLPLSIFVV